MAFHNRLFKSIVKIGLQVIHVNSHLNRLRYLRDTICLHSPFTNGRHRKNGRRLYERLGRRWRRWWPGRRRGSSGWFSSMTASLAQPSIVINESQTASDVFCIASLFSLSLKTRPSYRKWWVRRKRRRQWRRTPLQPSRQNLPQQTHQGPRQRRWVAALDRVLFLTH